MIGMLGQGEIMICTVMGTLRRKNAMIHNEDRRYSNRNPFEIDIDGFIGEYIIAKHLNIMPDFTLNERRTPADLILPDGRTVDVKTTRSSSKGIVITGYHRESPCDIYVLIQLMDHHYEIVGWLPKEDCFDNPSDIKDRYGNPSKYIVDREKLHGFNLAFKKVRQPTSFINDDGVPEWLQ